MAGIFAGKGAVAAVALSLFLSCVALDSTESGAICTHVPGGQCLRSGHKNPPADAVVRRGPLGQVTRELYVESPGPGVAAVVGVSCLGPGLRRREVHAHEAKSDLGEKYRERYSEDNGRTWSAFRPVSFGTDTLRHGENFMEESATAVNYDPVSKRTIEVIFQRVFLGDPQQALAAYWKGETRFYDHCYYRLSEDDGRTFAEYRQLTYEDGAPFNSQNWNVPEFLARNQMYGGFGRRSRESGAPLVFNPIASAISKSPMIPFSSKRSAILSGCISILPRTPWSCASTRRARFKRWIVPNPFSRWAWAMSKA
jgi:hypothetical protein